MLPLPVPPTNDDGVAPVKDSGSRWPAQRPWQGLGPMAEGCGPHSPKAPGSAAGGAPRPIPRHLRGAQRSPGALPHPPGRSRGDGAGASGAPPMARGPRHSAGLRPTKRRRPPPWAPRAGTSVTCEPLNAPPPPMRPCHTRWHCHGVVEQVFEALFSRLHESVNCRCCICAIWHSTLGLWVRRMLRMC